jgi:hypothetical protein
MASLVIVDLEKFTAGNGATFLNIVNSFESLGAGFIFLSWHE